MAATLEDRFAMLEQEVAQLRVQVNGQRPNVTGRTSHDFLQSMVGIHAESPAFEEVTRQLAAEREQEREAARRLPVEDEA